MSGDGVSAVGRRRALFKSGDLLWDFVLDDVEVVGLEAADVVALVVGNCHVELHQHHVHVQTRRLVLSREARRCSDQQQQARSRPDSRYTLAQQVHRVPSSPVVMFPLPASISAVRAFILPCRNWSPVSLMARISAGQSSMLVAEMLAIIWPVNSGTSRLSMPGE